MDKKVGFIGCGNMASAIMGGIIQKGIVSAENIMGSDAFVGSLEKVQGKFQICTSQDNKEVASYAEILFLSVKPQYYETVISEIAPVITPEKIVVTIAPGKTLSWLGEKFGKEVKIIRTMPNTPALVGAGMTGVCHNNSVTKEELELVCQLFEGFGKYELIEEHLMDAVVSVSGSSPAYVFMMIEAMADAAVRDGMPRAKAYEFAAQAVYGSAKMVMETGKHPGELKDMVCSPAGTTIEAVRILEEKGFRSSIMEAMKACTEKSKSL